ncbi:hypothetical protein METHB2_430011 [Candidatus Methylobacter favarea]|uniref:Uncharacterized protein n=1 Tax=Candidatus Methylobacter favarea TaxID=2707345 RepID=A0A8S0X1Z7_9GAMM|nr:hypothetical protein METHB2_430011 [Candidatus Methylobacter favarea]
MVEIATTIHYRRYLDQINDIFIVETGAVLRDPILPTLFAQSAEKAADTAINL